MKVDCGNCGRSFDLDDQRVENVAALMCLCGNRLGLKPQVPGPGQRLGKYVLINRIAVGGMGEIYYGKVSGIEGFEKEVAIKKMLPHLSNDRDFINMMVKEAKLTVLLSHPNVVGVYDLAKEGEEYYIAMEYVPGVTVGAILEQARRSSMLLPPEVAVHITMQLLRGLGYAHNLPGPNGERLTILHRDITPQNILVTQHAYVKITDFGIAKAINEISTTSPGMIKGKLGYIAPEQLEGHEPDQRVDIFCAGILLWEMLAVRRLFKGSTEIDTFRLISECKVPSLATLRDDITPQLEAVILKGLAREPANRFGRAEDFYSALNQAIYPRTADDFQEITDVFFAQHPEFFASVAAHKGSPMMGDADSTRSVPITGVNSLPAPENLEPVSRFLRVNMPQNTGEMARPTASPWPLLAGMALGLLLLAGGAVAMFFVRKQSAPPPVQQITSNTPPPPAMGTPPPSTAPSTPPAKAPTAPSASPTVATPPPPAREPREPRRESPARPLTGSEIQATVQRSQGDIARCLNDMGDGGARTGRLEAQITIDTSGRVTMVQFSPVVEHESLERCLTRSLKAMHFRRHPAPDQKVRIPLQFQVL